MPALNSESIRDLADKDNKLFDKLIPGLLYVGDLNENGKYILIEGITKLKESLDTLLTLIEDINTISSHSKDSTGVQISTLINEKADNIRYARDLISTYRENSQDSSKVKETN